MPVQLDIKPKAKKFIEKLPPKHQRQIKDFILGFLENPVKHDAKILIGYPDYLRATIGEYRVIYRFDKTKELITIVLVGKRNDGDVYKRLRRLVS